MSNLNSPLDQLCVNTIRGLAIDGVQQANSGHPGLPLGAAAIAYTVWMRHLRFNPRNARWFNRDRFVLSAGHGSMLLYALLHLTGYQVSLDDLKAFRQWNSITPGHPESGLTPGVEMATGPLGQGVATSVGMAIAERFLAATFNRPGLDVIDHFTYVVCSDGDLMEGVAQEACSLAGHLGLGRLILLFDDNSITIDGSTALSNSEDTAAKFQAMGWQVLHADGNDIEGIDQAIHQAKSESGRPSLIVCKTIIGYGSPNRAGTSKAHGAPLGAEELKLTKKALGLPDDQTFIVSDEVRNEFAKCIERGAQWEVDWLDLFSKYGKSYPDETRLLIDSIHGDLDLSFVDALPSFDASVATRSASSKVINAVAPRLKTLLGGSADLAESVLTHMAGVDGFQKGAFHGRNLSFGIREHAMAAAVNGITLHGGCRAFGGTFLVFSDYCRPSIRLAALMHCPSIFVFSHDSVGLGEDGPTHQPVEHVMSLRTIPNLNVMRPADGNETSACWKIALDMKKAPSALILTRQSVPATTPSDVRNHPAEQGGYTLQEASSGAPKIVLVATGSEVGLAIAARERLEAEGIPARVVSLPSWFLFESQSEEYRESVIPRGVPAVSVEAGTTLGWARYAQAHVGLDRFGASAPGDVVMRELGLTTDHVVAKAEELLEKA